MSADEANFLERLRSLSLSATQELLGGFHRLKQIHEEWVGEAEPEAGASAADIRARLGDLVYQLARSELEHAESLLRASHVQADLLFDHARSLVRASKAGTQPPAPVVPLHRSIRDNDTPASGKFEIRSPFEAEASPRFTIGAFARDTGQAADWLSEKASVSCKPSPLPPRGTADVTVTVDLTNTPDDRVGLYFADLTVHLAAHVDRKLTRRLLKLNIERD